MSASRHQFEFWMYRLFRGGLVLLSPRWARAVLDFLFWRVHETFGWRKAETIRRIAQVFPDRSEAERRSIRRGAVRNLACNVIELLRPDSVSPTDLPIEEAFHAVQATQQAGRGVLLVIAHCGNWDLAGVVAANHGIPMCFIARKQKNERIYRELLRAREAGGGLVVDRDDPKLVRKLIAFLGNNGAVAILIDIRSRQSAGEFRFLGHPAALANGLGLLAAKSGAEVLPIFIGRDAEGCQFWKSFPARRLAAHDPKSARHDLLQSCLDDLSPEILRHPESYFWFNKRWVLEPHAVEDAQTNSSSE